MRDDHPGSKATDRREMERDRTGHDSGLSWEHGSRSHDDTDSLFPISQKQINRPYRDLAVLGTVRLAVPVTHDLQDLRYASLFVPQTGLKNLPSMYARWSLGNCNYVKI